MAKKYIAEGKGKLSDIKAKYSLSQAQEVELSTL